MITRHQRRVARPASGVGRWLAVIAVGLALVMHAGLAAAARETGSDTGLPIPRFVSLRADTVNMRAGPGLRYPIEWVFKRQGLPMAVLEEFNAWRKVRTADGTRGWVHAAMLTGKRTARVVGGSMRALLAEPADTASTIALVEPGAIGTLDDCNGAYCRVDLGAHSGWLKRSDIFGVPRRAAGN
jgi:SH3-like domain-containing protein